MQKLVTIVIPCLNEEETLPLCLAEISKVSTEARIDFEVIVADNGSTDRCVEIAKKFGAIVEEVPTRGYGAAVHAGIVRASGKFVVMGDADMSYPFYEVPRMLDHIVQTGSDFVLGSRLKGTIEKNAMPVLNRYVGTPVLNFVINTIYRLNTSDCNSGMRIFKRERYGELGMTCPGMEFASEMIVKVAKFSFIYSEIPIDFRKDRRTRAPHLKRWRDGWRHLRFILASSGSQFLPILFLVFSATLFLAALLISVFDPSHYHTGLLLAAATGPSLTLPLSILSMNVLLSDKDANSRLVTLFDSWAENSYPFYFSALFFAWAAIELLYLFFQWARFDFSQLQEFGSVVRLILAITIGTSVLAFDFLL